MIDTRWRTPTLATLRRPLWGRLVRGSAWHLVGDAGARGLSFLASIIIARVLGPSDYAAFVLVQSTTGMLATFAQFGMGTTVIRCVAAYRSTELGRVENVVRTLSVLSFATGVLATVLLIATSSWLASKALNIPSIAPLLAGVAPVLCFQVMTSIMGGVVLGFEAFGTWARLSWAANTLAFVVLLGGLWTAGLAGAVGALVAGELVRLALTGFVAQRTLQQAGLSLFGRINWEEFRLLGQFSLPVFLVGLLNAPVVWVCQALLAQKPEGLVAIAMYDATQKWLTVVTMIPMAAAGAFLPVVASVFSEKGRLAIRRVTARAALLEAVIAAVPAFAIGAAAPWAATPFGPDFSGVVPVLPVVMASAPIFIAKHVYWQALVGAGRAWATLAIQVCWAVLAVAMTAILSELGAMGLALAMFVAYSAALLLSVVIIERGSRQWC